MQQDIQELRNLPLEKLISAPLNAVIAAQANAALSTATFIEHVGLKPEKENTSLFDDPAGDENKYDVRMARLKVTKKVLDNGNVTDQEEAVELPFISLFNIPAFEINSLDWDFNVKLKSIQEHEMNFTHTVESTTGGNANATAGLQSLGIPVGIGAGAKVEVSSTTNFESRFGAGREQEYNLHINVKANAAPLPKGIERLLDIAERIATENQAVNQLTATTTPPTP